MCRRRTGGFQRLGVDPVCILHSDGDIQPCTETDRHPQDRGDVVQAMPVIQGLGRQGLHAADDGGGAEFQGETAVTVAMSVVREVIGKGVTGGAPPNPARHGKRGVRAGGRQGRQVQ